MVDLINYEAPHPDGLLVKYEAACRAIAEAATVDEAKDWADKAAALQAYVRQAKNTEAEREMARIRLRARRKVGEMTKQVSLGKRGRKAEGDFSSDGENKSDVIKKAGLSWGEVGRCEKLAEVPEADFEAYIDKCRDTNKVASSDEIAKRVTKTVSRKAKIDKILEKNAALPTDKRYNVLYADPPWQYRNVVSEDRRLENHYPTMPLNEICALPVSGITADDAILFFVGNDPRVTRRA